MIAEKEIQVSYKKIVGIDRKATYISFERPIIGEFLIQLPNYVPNSVITWAHDDIGALVEFPLKKLTVSSNFDLYGKDNGQTETMLFCDDFGDYDSVHFLHTHQLWIKDMKDCFHRGEEVEESDYHSAIESDTRIAVYIQRHRNVETEKKFHNDLVGRILNRFTNHYPKVYDVKRWKKSI